MSENIVYFDLEKYTVDDYGRYVYGWGTRKNKKGGEVTQYGRYVLVPQTSGTYKSGARVYGWTEGSEALLDAIVKNGQYQKLRSLLIKHYGLSESSSGQDDMFMDAFRAAVYSATVENTNRVRNGKKNLVSLMDYLNTKKVDSGTSGEYSGPRSSVYLTGKQQAKDYFRSAVNQLTGKNPSKADFEEFYEELTKAQKKYVNRQVGKYDQTITENRFNLEDYTLRYIVKKLEVSSDMSGQVGAVQDLINQVISDYGLSNVVGTSTKIKMLKGLLKGKLQEKDIDDTFRDMAKVTYSAFADDIDKNPNVSFQDIISPYVQTYNSLLEKTGIDTDISKVLGLASKDGKKLTLNEFQQLLKKSEEYQFTNRAKADASNLAVAFARAFGVNI